MATGVQIITDGLSRLIGTAIAMAAALLVFLSATCALAVPEMPVKTLTDRASYSPGDTAIVILDITVPAGYHLYGNPLGPGIGKPMVVRSASRKGIRWIEASASKPDKFRPEIGDWVWAYEKRARIFLKGQITAKTDAIDTIALEALICHTACIPIAKKIPVTIPVDLRAGWEPFSNPGASRREYEKSQSFPLETALPPVRSQAGVLKSLSGLAGLSDSKQPQRPEAIPSWDYSPLEPTNRMNIMLAVLLGLLAGVLLNFMPCVLPVVGIKILSFSEGREESRNTAVIKSLIFSAGMLVIFLGLACLAAFAQFSWGEHFQNPKVLSAIVIVTVVFALGLFDFYTLSVPLSSSAQAAGRKRGWAGDFFRGMLTAILATPCSGPFLGATLAWTLRQSIPVIFAVFISVGLGMAAPYVVLSASNRLRRLIPKPGKWMDDFKHIMGFFLLGVTIYLMIALPGPMVVSTVGMCLVILFALAIYRRFIDLSASLKRKIVVACIVLGIFLAGLYLNFGVIYRMISYDDDNAVLSPDVKWRDFSIKDLSEAHLQGRHVIIDFTASWCMNCQYNKIAVLQTPEIMDLIKKKNIMAIKADITKPQPVIESLLHHLGSQSVPFFAIFPGDDPYKPVIMRDILNKAQLIKVLKALPDK